MSVKFTGVQWKAFYADKNWWPESKFHDDEIIYLNGADSRVPIETPENVADTDVVFVEYGDVMKKVGPLGAEYFSDLPEYATAWLKNQTHTDLVVQCSNDLVDQVVEAIEAAGGKVISPTKLKGLLKQAPVRYMGEIHSCPVAHAQSLASKETGQLPRPKGRGL